MQRKVFRVERMLGGRAAACLTPAPHKSIKPAQAAPPLTADANVQALKRELARLHEAIAHNKRELAVLIGEGRERRMAHAAGKLGAAVEGMEKATEKILKSSEVIDESARALAASLKTDYERGLAQDIQDHVVKIFEACNFQDISGQRIGHVIETLNMIEDQVEAMLDRDMGAPGEMPATAPTLGQALLNGPRLDGASGYTDQSAIDAMFD